MKTQPLGLETVIYPEGQKLSYTISKKIVLARSILKKPKLLILENPLDQFDRSEALHIISYLTDLERPWALIVTSQNKDWADRCNRVITLENGQLIKSL